MPTSCRHPVLAIPQGGMMNASALPYIPRPNLEEDVRPFLLANLTPRPSTTKALLLSGKKGIGKKTLLARLLQQETQLSRYTSFILDLNKQSLYDTAKRDRGLHQKAFDSATEIAAEASPFLLQVVWIIFQNFAKDLIFPAKSPKTFETLAEVEDAIFALAEEKPLLLHIENFNDQDPEHARTLAHLVNEGYLRKSAWVIAILTHEEQVDDQNPSKNIRRFLRNDDHLRCFAVPALAKDACVTRLAACGLSPEWAQTLHNFSAGHPGLMNSLWQLLQEEGILDRTGTDKWNARDDPQPLLPADLARRGLQRLIAQRCPQLSPPFDAYLLDGLFMAAAMGETFLPQAVAETVIPAERKHSDEEIGAWEDTWYEFLEAGDETSPPMAKPMQENGRNKTISGANNRLFFVHAFEDQKWKYLLSHIARQMCDPLACNRPFYESLAQLEDWLQRWFQENWLLALPYRIAVNRTLWRFDLAASLEKQLRRHHLLTELPPKINQERQRVATGAAAGTLYQLLLWYGEVLRDCGEYPTALEIVLEAQQLVDQHKVTLSELELASLLDFLARCYHDNGHYAAAEPLYRRALGIYEQHLGPEHPEVARSLNNLGMLLQDQGHYAAAEPLFRRSLKILEQHLGPEHPHTRTVRKNYELLLAKMAAPQSR
ncbi:MAG: tetratricopeptide repeat protein [candidate division KSB1 bacterium]|nr:tetratricopeptide repeat protein [candidate division KSB1 bacterium]